MPVGTITPGSVVTVTPDGSPTAVITLTAPTDTMPIVAADVQDLTLAVVNGHKNLNDMATSLEGRATSLEGRATSLEGRATSLEGRATSLEASKWDALLYSEQSTDLTQAGESSFTPIIGVAFTSGTTGSSVDSQMAIDCSFLMKPGHSSTVIDVAIGHSLDEGITWTPIGMVLTLDGSVSTAYPSQPTHLMWTKPCTYATPRYAIVYRCTAGASYGFSMAAHSNFRVIRTRIAAVL
jgi:hypothetical protein